MAVALIGAVIDANILFQRYPRNLVVWLAVERAYRMIASEHIFDEVREHLIERNEAVQGEPRVEAVERTLELIQIELDEGPGELVPREPVDARVPSLQANDPDDRHVLAAAVEAGADLIVTHDEGGFDADECQRQGVEVVGLDEFLMRVVGSSGRDAIRAAVENCAKYPPSSVPALLEIVEETAPRFAVAARELFE